MIAPSAAEASLDSQLPMHRFGGARTLVIHGLHQEDEPLRLEAMGKSPEQKRRWMLTAFYRISFWLLIAFFRRVTNLFVDSRMPPSEPLFDLCTYATPPAPVH